MARGTDFKLILRWIVAASVVAMPILACRNLLSYATLARSLRDKPLHERASIGCDEANNPIARAGRIYVRKELSRDSNIVTSRSAYMAGIWTWLEQTGRSLPGDARIYINAPSAPLYYFGNFFWYPRRLSLSLDPKLIDGLMIGEDFEYVAASRFPELREAGYTYVVIEDAKGVSLIDLRREMEIK